MRHSLVFDWYWASSVEHYVRTPKTPRCSHPSQISITTRYWLKIYFGFDSNIHVGNIIIGGCLLWNCQYLNSSHQSRCQVFLKERSERFDTNTIFGPPNKRSKRTESNLNEVTSSVVRKALPLKGNGRRTEKETHPVCPYYVDTKTNPIDVLLDYFLWEIDCE